MARDIRFASLSNRLHRQLIQTANLLHTSYNKTVVSAWDGTPCDIVVADDSDRYGEYAIETAVNQGVPVVIVTDKPSVPHRSVDRNTSTAYLTRAVQAAIEQGASASAHNAELAT